MKEINVVVFGASRSGKTQLISRYVNHSFNANYEATIEELYAKEFREDGRFISLKILDTQGVEQFRAMRDVYISNADAFVIVYDGTDVGSLSELEGLAQQILKAKPRSPPLMVVGTKMDKHISKNSSADAVRAGAELASILGKPHITTSAKEDRQVQQVYEGLMKQIFKHEAFSRRHDIDASASTLSSVSIDGWLHTPQERAMAAPRHQPSLKQSMIKLKKSIANIRTSKSMRNVRKAFSSASLYKPFASSSSHNLVKHPASNANGFTGYPAPTQGFTCDARFQSRPQKENESSALRDGEGVEFEDPNLDTVTQSNLSEMPNIIDVGQERPRYHGQKTGRVCIIM